MRAPTFPSLTLPFAGGRLRTWVEDDVLAVAEAAADTEVQRWLPLPSPYTVEHARTYCLGRAPQLREQGEGLHLAAVTDAGALVGSIALKKTDWAARVTEVGYWTAPDARRRGLTTAAVAALSRWALASDGGAMQRVELRAATKSAGSRGVARRAGFVEEGTLRNAGYVHDARVDLVVYSLVPSDMTSSARLP